MKLIAKIISTSRQGGAVHFDAIVPPVTVDGAAVSLRRAFGKAVPVAELGSLAPVGKIADCVIAPDGAAHITGVLSDQKASKLVDEAVFVALELEAEARKGALEITSARLTDASSETADNLNRLAKYWSPETPAPEPWQPRIDNPSDALAFQLIKEMRPVAVGTDQVCKFWGSQCLMLP
ncbi:MAG TPA: hypothetical protein VND87_12140 [Stellaceae bacterium]|nr:hypothetical protein [Stellaceae bacterium]